MVHKPILEPEFWRKRLQSTVESNRHHAIYVCRLSVWEDIEHEHRKILYNTIKDNDSILDVGCAWGRLLDLLPGTWRGSYEGVDLSPDFISMAESKYPKRTFHTSDIIDIPSKVKRMYDWAVLISMRNMITDNLGMKAWANREVAIKKRAKNLLFLEYDVNDTGTILPGATDVEFIKRSSY